MPTNELVTFIKTQLDQGQTPDQVKMTLLAAGWMLADAEEGLKTTVKNYHPAKDALKSQSADADGRIMTIADVGVASLNPDQGPRSKIIFALVFIVIFGIAGGAIYIAYKGQKRNVTNNTKINVIFPDDQVTTVSPSPSPTPSENSEVSPSPSS